MALEQTWSPALRLRPTPVRAQAARRDAAAFASAYERHHQALYRYCRSMLRNEEDARDVLQSAMTKAIAALRDEERDFDLRPWLFRIVHNEAVSRLRQRRETVSLDAAGGVGADSLPQAIENRERIATLRSDLRDLPDRQSAALVLRELCGLSHQEIAAMLDTTPSAVKQSIFEARTALHEFDEGRAMVCAEVQRALSDGDGRVLRARRMRAHVRSCKPCRRFKAGLAQRPNDLAALAPALPASAGGALLVQAIAGVETGGVVAGIGTGVATTLAAKAAMIAATVATAAGATAVVHSAREHARPVAPVQPVSAPAAQPAVSAAAVPHHTAPGQSAHHAVAARPAAPAPRPTAHTQAPAHRAPAATDATAAPTRQDDPAVALAPGQAKKQADVAAPERTLPPGQAKKQAGAAPIPPGQAKKQTATDPIPPGQAKKQATSDPVPPGQAKKQAGAAAPQRSLPPGQAKQQATTASLPPGQAEQPAATVSLPPGQAKQADAAGSAPPQASAPDKPLPPGQAKK
jgi:RNA polymerase sigma factor (sigma-70 family)